MHSVVCLPWAAQYRLLSFAPAAEALHADEAFRRTASAHAVHAVADDAAFRHRELSSLRQGVAGVGAGVGAAVARRAALKQFARACRGVEKAV